MDNGVRVGLVVEDQFDTRCWLEDVLADTLAPIEIASVGNVQDGLAWLTRQRRALGGGGRRAVALIDLVLPDGSGIALIREIADNHPDVLPVVVSIYDSDDFLFDALAAGAEGYLLKDERPEVFSRRLREIDNGELPLSPSIARRILAHLHKAAAPDLKDTAESVALTSRERDVLGLLGKGLRVGDVAGELGLTRNTVAG